jgi:hypothetical protein
MAGYLKNSLDRESKAELLWAIEDYRAELVPLVVPVTVFHSTDDVTSACAAGTALGGRRSTPSQFGIA